VKKSTEQGFILLGDDVFFNEVEEKVFFIFQISHFYYFKRRKDDQMTPGGVLLRIAKPFVQSDCIV
jgi:hypothetical protein